MEKDMDNPEISKLFAKYINDECSPYEELLISKFLDSYQNSDEDWDESVLGNKKIVEEKIISKIQNKTDFKEVSFIYRYTKSPHLFKIAASILFIIMAVSSYLYINTNLTNNSDNITWNEKVTLLGQKSVITLFDGTSITLNADSKLKYPNQFGNDSREIYIEGEAYLEVAHNSEWPFFVHSGKITTKVLGTKFNVKAFPLDDVVTVSLLEGKVQVGKTILATEKHLTTLIPNQQFRYDKKKDSEIKQQFDFRETFGWKNNILVFDDTNLESVLIHVERAFGVELELENKSVGAKKLKVNFENDSFWTIIKVIKNISGLEFKTVEENNELKKIVFYKSK